MFASQTWSHPDITSLNWDELDDHFTRVEQALQKIIGVQPAFFRPPYGIFNDLSLQVAASHGLSAVMWDFDSGDSVGASVSESNALYDAVAAKHPNNLLPLNHETYSTTVYQVIPHAVQKLKATGYTFGTVAESRGWQQPYQWTTQPGSTDSSWHC